MWAAKVAATASSAFLSRVLAKAAAWPPHSCGAVQAIESQMLEALDPWPPTAALPSAGEGCFPPAHPQLPAAAWDSWASWLAGVETTLALGVALRAGRH